NYSLQYGHMRQGRPGIRGRMIHIEPRMSLTAGSADRWIPVPPGYEGLLALSLAQVIVSEGLAVPGFEGWTGPLAPYAPEKMEATLEVPARTLHDLARDFAGTRPALAIAGGPALAHTNGVQTASAVHALNMLVGSVGAAGGLLASPPTPVREFNAFAPGSFSDLVALTDRMRAGQVQALLVHQADPAYLLPKRLGFREALAKVPFIVSFSPFVDDTTAFADLILPDHTFLESWGIATSEPSPGVPVLTSQQPVVAPVFDTRPTPDVLLSVGKALGGPVAAALPWPSYVDLVKSTWTSVSPQAPTFWADVRQAGLWTGKTAGPGAPKGRTTAPTVPAPTFSGSEQEFPFAFYPYLSSSLHDGRAANLPWQQELPDPMTAGVWSSWVEINPATARKLGLEEGDAVQVRSPHGTLAARVHLFPGIHPAVLAMPMGQGHQFYGRYAAGRGSNPMDVVDPTPVPGSGGLAWAATRVSLEKAAEAPTFTKVERRPWPPEGHEAPGYMSLEDLVNRKWPWNDHAGGPHGGTSQ
ncbi:MAG TPA: molybdopterin dinucleotide binding domain-containing protein, partial [Stenomitos sp.]